MWDMKSVTVSTEPRNKRISCDQIVKCSDNLYISGIFSMRYSVRRRKSIATRHLKINSSHILFKVKRWGHCSGNAVV